MSWRDRIRELVAAGVLIVSVGAGAVFWGGPNAQVDAVRVAAFNIQVFGKTKASDDAIMDVLARVVRSFDVVLVQEVRDRDEEVADRFLDRINRDADLPYAMIEGPRLGRTSSKEQYVLYYRPSIVRFIDSFTVPDPDNRFEREPLVTRFQARFFDFRLVAAHIKPDDAYDELAALADVAEAVVDSTEGDVILLGDFNADCDYFTETDASHPLKAAAFHWVITNDTRTAVTSGCTYDRIVLLDGTYGAEYVPNSAHAFRYDSEFGITDANFVRRVSDHYPVYAEFRITGPDDDGADATTPQSSAGAAQFVASRQGHVYYRVGCDAARRISPANVISFTTEAEAQQAGYRRSRARGC
jgi:endonuclease/exonuclease/phosphatase family metal-dependent hydrolase